MKVLKQEIEGKTCITLVFDNTQEDDAIYSAMECMTARDEKIPALVVEHSGPRHRAPLQKFLMKLRGAL